MKSCTLATLVVLLAFSSSSAAQQPKIQRAVLDKVDAEKSIVTLKVNEKTLDAHADEATQFFESKKGTVRESLQAFKPGADVMFAVREKDGKNVLIGLRLLDKTKKPTFNKVDSSGLVPIDELGDKEYKAGFKGGFYPGGKNVRPRDHEAAGLKLAKEITPRNTEGKPDPMGKVVLMSVGMSNTFQASQGFAKVLANADGIHPRFQFVAGAQGGMTAARIQDPESPDGTKYWTTVDQMLKKAGVTRAQVQVVWIKQADAGPSLGFPGYARKLEEELANIVRIFPARFPNVKIVYLSSRTYGGYATTPLNPEPYAYESAFSVKWLIERQIAGEGGLNYDPHKGEVKAPWLSWGPYLWANGEKKRLDGFQYAPTDFTANDGTHLTPAGQEKVGRLMLRFFQTDTTARPWFLAR